MMTLRHEKMISVLVLLLATTNSIQAFLPSSRIKSNGLQQQILLPQSHRSFCGRRNNPLLVSNNLDQAAENIDESDNAIMAESKNEEKMEDSVDNILGGKERFMMALPKLGKKDELDDSIIKTAVPSMINLGVVPIVNAVDTFWVGRLGSALALAGQAAANQASWTLFFLVAFLPNITAPLVASAVASGKQDEAQARVSESLFLCNVLGLVGTVALVGFPRTALQMILPADAPVMEFAAPYLRWRGLGIIPSLVSATGFAAYRGLLNTVTPLKVSLATNAVNLILDPLMIFGAGVGFVGAAMATVASELLGGLTYLRLLLRRELVRWSLLLKPPSWKKLLPLLQGGAALLFRQLAINIGLLAATRRAQVMDPTGVSAAAYGVVMQIYSVGIVILVAFQSTAAALVSVKLAKSKTDARLCADRLFTWGTSVGVMLGTAQFLALPYLVPIFSTLPEVRKAVVLPGLLSSVLHWMNGAIFAGEGILMGLGCYKDLALITIGGIGAMLGCLASPLGKRLDGIMWSLIIWSFLQCIGVVYHHLKISPLALRRKKGNQI